MARIYHRPKAKGDWVKQTRFDYYAAKKMLFEFGKVTTTFVVHGQDRITPIAAVYKDERQQTFLHNIIRLVCIAEAASAVAVFGEGWFARSLPDEPIPERPRVKPKDREDRREMIMAQVVFRSFDGLMATLMMGEIVRNADGKPTQVIKEITDPPSAASKGNIGSLLPIDPVTLPQQEEAKRVLQKLQDDKMLEQIKLDLTRH
jgi:hypothetical protein